MARAEREERKQVGARESPRGRGGLEEGRGMVANRALIHPKDVITPLALNPSGCIDKY